MFTTVNQVNRLSVDEENNLAHRWLTHGDEAALGRMVKAHLGLVIHIAQGFRNAGPSMDDLIQEGSVGLMIAARRFDPAKNARLATYASYWIKACITEYVVRSHGPVRIGTTRAQRKIFFGLGRARRQLESEGRTAVTELLASRLGVLPEELETMAPRLARGRDVLLDAPRGGEDTRPAGVAMAYNGPTPEETVADLEEDGWQKSRLQDGLHILDSRERAIIRARYLRTRPVTLRALGRMFVISRERVRQLELRALDKLRKHCSR